MLRQTEKRLKADLGGREFDAIGVGSRPDFTSISRSIISIPTGCVYAPGGSWNMDMMVAGSLASVLLRLSEQPFYGAEFEDAETNLPGITDAVEKGYARRVLMGGWSPWDERHRLTDLGRAALGSLKPRFSACLPSGWRPREGSNL